MLRLNNSNKSRGVMFYNLLSGVNMCGYNSFPIGRFTDAHSVKISLLVNNFNSVSVACS